MIFEDMHTHTAFSPDVEKNIENSLYSMAKTAKNSGISYIAFTDHYDFDGVRGLIHDIDGCKEEFENAKSDLADKSFTPIWSIELGSVNEFRKEAEEILKKYPFDFVLASLHMNPGEKDVAYYDFSDREKYPAQSLKNILDVYFAELKSICRDFDFDSLAHIGYPLRYFKRHGRHEEIELSEYDDRLREIFSLLIKRDKCLEVNTSGLRQGHGDTFPSERALKMYYEMGGRNITLGSDSHGIQFVCANFKEVKQKLKEIGFTHTCVYVDRKKKEILI